MLRDLRFGIRMLLLQPGFTFVAIVTLALGVGATAAVFSLIQGVLLTPPPYKEPRQLVLIPAVHPGSQQVAHARGWASAQWTEWQKQAKSFDDIGAYSWSFNFLITSDGSESLQGMAVTRDYFRTTGLAPLVGRTFSESETGATVAPVIVLGYNLWQRKFNGDPHIIGKKIRMSRRNTPPTVIA